MASLPDDLLPHPSQRAAGLFLRLTRFGASSHFALGHVAGQTTNVVLKNLVLVLELVVIGLNRFDTLGEGL